MKVIVTGAAGFIGFHVSNALMARGDTVVGIDNINDYYDVNLKHARLDILNAQDGFEFHKADLSDADAINPFKIAFMRRHHRGMA